MQKLIITFIESLGQIDVQFKKKKTNYSKIKNSATLSPYIKIILILIIWKQVHEFVHELLIICLPGLINEHNFLLSENRKLHIL